MSLREDPLMPFEAPPCRVNPTKVKNTLAKIPERKKKMGKEEEENQVASFETPKRGKFPARTRKHMGVPKSQ